MPFSPLGLICTFAFAVLMTGSLVTWGLVKMFPKRDYANLRQRILTWWIIVPVLAGSLFAGVLAVASLFAIVSILALREYIALTSKGGAPNKPWRARAAYILIPCQYILAIEGGLVSFLIFMPVCGLLLSATGSGGRNLALGLLLAAFGLSHLARLATLPNGREWLAFVLVVTQCNDVAQYVWGRTMGRTPLLPKISPNKTREGLYGGLATTVLLAALLGPWVTSFDAPRSMLFGALLALLGVLGDLTVSALKRRGGVKDAGKMLPGHGGVLDRVDSLVYAAPALLYGILLQ